ncbi:hypothetical protein PUN28_011875 [Cardiocondyla obscurior]|uniref:Uncharacterized protein n=1 Tax=Cardiocondyla obscurior TaxID=286306 RepID=A0AAW2FHX5_9HYME
MSDQVSEVGALLEDLSVGREGFWKAAEIAICNHYLHLQRFCGETVEEQLKRRKIPRIIRVEPLRKAISLPALTESKPPLWWASEKH